MDGVHIYRAEAQPLTRYYDRYIERWIRHPRRQVWKCHKCRRGRWAENLCIQLYYDTTYVFCRRGGCAKERA